MTRSRSCLSRLFGFEFLGRWWWFLSVTLLFPPKSVLSWNAVELDSLLCDCGMAENEFSPLLEAVVLCSGSILELLLSSVMCTDLLGYDVFNTGTRRTSVPNTSEPRRSVNVTDDNNTSRIDPEQSTTTSDNGEHSFSAIPQSHSNESNSTTFQERTLLGGKQ